MASSTEAGIEEYCGQLVSWKVVIANGVLQISVVREAGKIIVYMLRHGTL